MDEQSLVPYQNMSPGMLPEIKVDGRQLDDPAHAFDGVMTEITQLAMLGQLHKLNKHFQDRTSQGQVLSVDEIITDQLFTLKFPVAVMSVTVINSGHSPVKLWVNNTHHNPRVCRPYLTATLNFESHVLECIYLQCEPGVTTSVEITAQY
jgi:hypothetical protein